MNYKNYKFCFQNVCGLFNAVSLFYSGLPLEELDGEIEHPGAGEPDPSEMYSADKSLAVFCSFVLSRGLFGICIFPSQKLLHHCHLLVLLRSQTVTVTCALTL